jgi:hypothetical protein
MARRRLQSGANPAFPAAEANRYCGWTPALRRDPLGRRGCADSGRKSYHSELCVRYIDQRNECVCRDGVTRKRTQSKDDINGSIIAWPIQILLSLCGNIAAWFIDRKDERGSTEANDCFRRGTAFRSMLSRQPARRRRGRRIRNTHAREGAQHPPRSTTPRAFIGAHRRARPGDAIDQTRSRFGQRC